MNVRDYVSQTDRVAATCIAASRVWIAKFTSREAALVVAGPVQHAHDLVLRLLKQLARQGLMPADVDNPDGIAAVGAVADAVFGGLRPRTQQGTWLLQGNVIMINLPDEWRHVGASIARMLSREQAAKKR